MSAPDPLLLDTVRRMMQERCPPETVTAAEDGTWPDALWSALEEAGLALAWVPETAGGAGASLADGFACARVAAEFAAPVPLAETLLAGWLLAEAGMEAPAGAMSVAGAGLHLDAEGRVAGCAARVAFARHAAHLAVLAERGGEPFVALVPARACRVAHGESLAGEALDEVRLDAAVPIACTPAPEGASRGLRRMGATLRAQQIAGALAGILEQSLGYARDRVQFGRPIARFQAVQHNLAMLAGEVAAAGAAADAAAEAVARDGAGDERAFLAVASAKIRAGEAAGAGAAIAHQVHGAMGFTREYSLHHRTRRLWAWRDDFGAESQWAIELGEHVAARGADALWPAITEV